MGGGDIWELSASEGRDMFCEVKVKNMRDVMRVNGNYFGGKIEM